MNEKKRTELLKLMKYGSDPDLALYDEVMESNEKLEVIAQKLVELNVPFNELEPIKGDQGEKGEKGDKGEPGKDGKDGRPGRDGKDGRDGRDGENGLDGLDGKDGVDGKDGTQITPDQVIEKINSSEEKIDSARVEKLEDLIKKIENLGYAVANIPRGGGGSGGIEIFKNGVKVGGGAAINFTGSAIGTVTTDGHFTNVAISGGAGGGYTKETPTGVIDTVNKIFTVTSTPVYIVADGSTYFENAGYTIVGFTVTMADAPTQFIRSFY